MDRVVSMRYRIGDSLENGRHVVLWTVGSPHGLERSGLHVLDHEATGFDDLTIQRPGYVSRVQLVGVIPRTGADRVASVGNRLHVGIGQPTTGLLAGNQHTGDRGPHCPLFDRSCHAKLAQKGVPVIVGAYRAEPLPQAGCQVLHPGAVHDLLVEADETGLAALQEHTGEILRGHRSLFIPYAVNEPARTPVDEQAPGYLDLNHRHILPCTRGQR